MILVWLFERVERSDMSDGLELLIDRKRGDWLFSFSVYSDSVYFLYVLKAMF